MTFLKSCATVLLFAPAFSIAAECTTTIEPTTPIEAVGAYSSPFPASRGNGLNYSYGVDLWHAGDCYFGYFTVAVGHEGDPPYGVLSFRSTPKGNRISFTSKLSIGARYQGAGQPTIPTMDLFEFSGTFSKWQINGTFRYTDKLNESLPIEQKVRLKLIPKPSLYLSKKGTTFADWRADATRTLQTSGPKW